MKKPKKRLLQDMVLLAVSIIFAVFLVKSGTAERFITSLNDLKWLGIIFAGMLFTSVFTTSTSIALISVLAETTSLPSLVVLGGLGAVVGDYVILRFVKDRMAEDLKYLLSFSKKNRFFAIFKTRLFKFFGPLIGAVIIASPFPDELGIALIGASKLKDRFFFLISFVANGSGILAIGWMVKSIIES